MGCSGREATDIHLPRAKDTIQLWRSDGGLVEAMCSLGRVQSSENVTEHGGLTVLESADITCRGG
jgi:hypothetical protein